MFKIEETSFLRFFSRPKRLFPIDLHFKFEIRVDLVLTMMWEPLQPSISTTAPKNHFKPRFLRLKYKFRIQPYKIRNLSRSDVFNDDETTTLHFSALSSYYNTQKPFLNSFVTSYSNQISFQMLFTRGNGLLSSVSRQIPVKNSPVSSYFHSIIRDR